MGKGERNEQMSQQEGYPFNNDFVDSGSYEGWPLGLFMFEHMMI